MNSSCFELKKSFISNQSVVGFIMDGNRRWAKKNNATIYDAYIKGFEIFCLAIDACIMQQINKVVFYVLSSDNFSQRSDDELKSIFNVGLNMLEKNKNYFIQKKIKILFIGNYTILKNDIKNIIINLEGSTNIENPIMTVYLLFLYNALEDVFCANNKTVLKYSYDIPNINIIIRTGGDNRLSGFLPIQSMYANIICLEEFWPDLDTNIIFNAISKKFTNNYGK